MKPYNTGRLELWCMRSICSNHPKTVSSGENDAVSDDSKIVSYLEESPQASKQSVASCYSLSVDMQLGCFQALTIDSIVQTT